MRFCERIPHYEITMWLDENITNLLIYFNNDIDLYCADKMERTCSRGNLFIQYNITPNILNHCLLTIPI